jgi:AraC family transcriptional regulator
MASVKPPGLERHGTLVFAGLKRRHSLGRPIGPAIARQWQDFTAPNLGQTEGAAKFRYGICGKMPGGAEEIEYFTGLLLGGRSVLPEGFVTLTLPPALYAVFQHREHVSKLCETCRFLVGTVLPGAGLKPANSPAGVPEFIERYGETFAFETGQGGLEILIPIEE